MKYLLDTHAFIWSFSDSEKLSATARAIITDPENIICVSVITFWEIALKTSIKKFSFEGIVTGQNLTIAAANSFAAGHHQPVPPITTKLYAYI
ncbi:MAG: type II toxin-antitoxin system VapC family toxin [Dysgonamonadaceae bacterium]|jgi:PIN domain nuclease of toxin-antitoxin system|nr:type II toxin-antitoxin system VapC family toxin [Dysgonamonadaceae bacterium]